MRTGTLRITTIFNIGVLVAGIIFALLTGFHVITFSENGEKMLAMSIISCVILFAGIVSPKLPYNRHTGLRLSWTVQDEDTWNVTHRIIGYISLPIALLYLSCTWTIPNFEIVTPCTMVLWIGIPGAMSHVVFRKKMRGGLK